jgi:hypothetical protein
MRMLVYRDFTDDEQYLLRHSLLAAAVAVSAASPGRAEETVSEGFAAASFILERRDDYVASPLITSVIAMLQAMADTEQAFPDYVAVAKEPDAQEQAMETLRRVTALLDAREEPSEAAAYKGWLMSIARSVASAGKEDQGFLGRGGVDVNDKERQALAEIASALGMAPDPASETHR